MHKLLKRFSDFTIRFIDDVCTFEEYLYMRWPRRLDLFHWTWKQECNRNWRVCLGTGDGFQTPTVELPLLVPQVAVREGPLGLQGHSISLNIFIQKRNIYTCTHTNDRIRKQVKNLSKSIHFTENLSVNHSWWRFKRIPQSLRVRVSFMDF